MNDKDSLIQVVMEDLDEVRRTASSNPLNARGTVSAVRDYVKEGRFTLEEIGSSEEDLNNILEEASRKKR